MVTGGIGPGSDAVLWTEFGDFDDPVVNRLARRASASCDHYDIRRAYYQNEALMATLGVNFPRQLEVLRIAVNWPRLTVDSIEERLNFDGVRLGDDAGSSRMLWDWWQENNLDEESHLAHQEALVQKRAYVVVGPPEAGSDAPSITVHDPRGFAVAVDRVTRKVTDAVQIFLEDPDDPRSARAVTWYGRKVNINLRRDGKGWYEHSRLNHGMGLNPVVPIVNRGGIGDFRGRSEMDDVIPFTDAAMRILTGTQVAAELLALPQRVLLGADREDFLNADGTMSSTWQTYISALMVHPNSDAKVTQFAGADLRGFVDVVDMFGRLVSAVTGLPHSYLGLSSDNPASAEAINAAKDRLLTRVERRGMTFAGAWENVLRVAMRAAGKSIPSSARMEMVLRDPATPTLSSKADAVMKLTGQPILPVKAGRQMMGFSPERIVELEEMDRSGDPWDDPRTRPSEGNPVIGVTV